MEAYLKLVNKILDEGIERPNRTGVNAITIPHYHLEHDMSKGFPLLTTKKMAHRSIAVELEGFLKGITDKKWYEERKCSIWREWANPKAVDQRQIQWQNENANKYESFKTCVEESEKLRKQFQEEENDLGPIYGYQWRSFGKQYDSIKATEMNPKYPGQWVWHPNGINNGTDQLKNVLKSIKKNPNDRRMVVSAWNPNQMDMMALPPCHILWKVNILGDQLHLCWFQRSCDVPLGIPFNIASYAMLQLLLCKYSGLKPGKLSGFLDDVHIYVNQIDGIKEQLKREPRPLPTLDIACNEPFRFDEKGDLIVEWTHKDLALFDYFPHPSIKFEVAI